MSEWEVPKLGQSMHAFAGLGLFYSKYAPYLEMRIKPLRQLLKTYFKKTIPTIAWYPNLLLLFQDIKYQVTSSPILVRYYPTKLTFLKTNWSAEGMGWILW